MIKIKYGYARVSTTGQKEDRQLDELLKYGICQRDIYIDKQSGKDFKRPQYMRLYKRLKKDDLLVIKSIDRLGRNYSEIQQEWQKITKTKKADIIVLDMPLLDTTKAKDLLGTFIADLVLQLLSFVAENERINIKARQKEGIELAKKRGVKFGRPKRIFTEEEKQIFILYNSKKLSLSSALSQIKMQSPLFFYFLKKYRKGELC